MTNKSYNTICVSAASWDKIAELSKIFDCPKTELLEKVISPIYEIASAYSYGEIVSFPLVSRSSVVFQLYSTKTNGAFSKDD